MIRLRVRTPSIMIFMVLLLSTRCFSSSFLWARSVSFLALRTSSDMVSLSVIPQNSSMDTPITLQIGPAVVMIFLQVGASA